MCPDSIYSAHSIHYRIPESSGDEMDESEEEDAAAATAAGLLGKAICNMHVIIDHAHRPPPKLRPCHNADGADDDDDDDDDDETLQMLADLGVRGFPVI